MDEVTSLLETLAQLGVKLAAENGQLKISAAKGVLTSEVRSRVLEGKDEILRRLQGIAPEETDRVLTRIVPDPPADHLPFPLSDLQLGFYIANDPYMEYHVRPHYYLEFDRLDLDVAAYESAWNKALMRHRRELCVVNDDIELQLLAEAPEIKCRVYDWRALPADEVAARLLGLREEMKRQELPLDAWPWLDLRVSLWRENGAPRARIFYNHNNYFVDGFGLTQLLAEIDSYVERPEVSHPPLELSYRDAVLGIERLAASPAGEAAKSYWFSRLQGMPPPPPLPQKPGLNRRCRSRLNGREGFLEKSLWEAFKSRASALGLTPSNAIIAAYAQVIATWSNTDHFILSQMVTRRFAELHPDLTRMLGNFASLYPLEIKLEGSESFVDNARRIQSQVLADVRYLQLGGMRVLQELNRLKGSFGTASSPFVVGSGLFIKGYKKATHTVLETSQTLLDHQFFELADGGYYYRWDLLEEFFPEGMIEAMWEALRGLLHRLAGDGEAWHRRNFDLVSERDLGERRERNRTAKPIPGASAGLHAPLGVQASLRGDSPVLVSARGALGYRELKEWSGVLAAELVARGVGKGDLVPVVMDRDHEALAAVLAVLKAGAAYVPIDPRLPSARLGLLLSEVGSGIALTQQRYESLDWPDGVTPLGVPHRGESGGGGAGEIDAAASGTDLAYVIYTSGSTGRPKGAMIDHRGAMNTVLDINERFSVGPADRLLGVSAFNFDLSVYDIFGTLAAGACLVYPHPEQALDPGHWLDLALQERVTLWSSVPALMSLLVEAAERREARLPALRLVLLSGDRIPLDLPAAVRRIAPNASVVSLGGATEASIWSIIYPIEPLEIDPGWSTIPYGYPMVNQCWEVRDRNGKPCPTWVPGELYIGGVGLAQGYWNDEEKTRQSFRVDPLTGERLYRTGDLGRYLPGGCIEWIGRVDYQVKIQGHRIELGEIEAVLAEHPAVRQAVVAVQESLGARHRRLVGFIIPAEGSPLDGRQLESFLQSRLPAYMVPTAWRTIEQLPLTGNGKVDRKALLQTPLDTTEEADRFSSGTETVQGREFVAPSNSLESSLQAIWERILGTFRIGVTDDFFELGGQSFDAIRIFALIKEEFGKGHTLSDMWRARTIRGLAKGIAGGEESGGERSVVPIDLRGKGEALFLVHPAGGSVMTYSRLGRLIDRPLYGIQASTRAKDVSHRRDIIELAGRYVADVREIQKNGPYSLGGWSSGAMIAFEMAAQLEAAGEQVAQVYILDGPVPVGHGELNDERLLLWFLDDLALGLPLERLRDQDFSGQTLEEQLLTAETLLEVGNGAKLDLKPLLANFQIFRDLIVAGSRYVPKTISADLTVIRVAEDVVDEFSTHPHRNESDWGWRGFTRGQVRCARVPGTHHSFLTEPLVDGWCALLSEVEPSAVGRM